MYNQHTRGMATSRHRSLVGRSGGRGFVRNRPSKKKIYIFQHTDISNLKRFEQIELQAKLLNYFLGGNKSNINQYQPPPPCCKSYRACTKLVDRQDRSCICQNTAQTKAVYTPYTLSSASRVFCCRNHLNRIGLCWSHWCRLFCLRCSQCCRRFGLFFGVTDDDFLVFVFCLIFISRAHSVSITPSTENQAL